MGIVLMPKQRNTTNSAYNILSSPVRIFEKYSIFSFRQHFCKYWKMDYHRSTSMMVLFRFVFISLCCVSTFKKSFEPLTIWNRHYGKLENTNMDCLVDFGKRNGLHNSQPSSSYVYVLISSAENKIMRKHVSSQITRFQNVELYAAGSSR